MDYTILLFLLIGSHMVCDYALQSDFIANAKNHNSDVGKLYWKFVLPAHGFIHAMGVYIVTQSLYASIFQLVTHCVIDYLKCDNKISFNVDQWLHITVMFIISIFVGV